MEFPRRSIRQSPGRPPLGHVSALHAPPLAILLVAILGLSSAASPHASRSQQRPLSLAPLPQPLGPLSSWGLLVDPRPLARSVLEAYGSVVALMEELDSTLLEVPAYARIAKGNAEALASEGRPGPVAMPQWKMRRGQLPNTREAGEGTPMPYRMKVGQPTEDIEGSSAGDHMWGRESAGGSDGVHVVHHRQLAEHPQQQDIPDVDLSGLRLPRFLPVFFVSNGTYTPLAMSRTQRANPLNGLQTYTGGWDFFASGYWASLTWTTIYGAIIGIAWALFGLGFVVVLLCICLCCSERWGALRDGSLKYSNKDLLLPLIFMVLGVLIACTGLGLMIAGGVMFKNTASSLTNFAVDEVERIASVLGNVTKVLAEVNSTQDSLNYTFPPTVQQKYNGIMDKASSLSQTLRDTAADAGNTVNGVLKTLQLILFILGCVTVGCVLLGFVFGLLRWVIASNMMTVIVWALIITTWIFVTIFVFVWLFSGDTSEALYQVAGQPATYTRMARLIPCANTALTSNVAAFSRYLGSATIFLMNATVHLAAPKLFYTLGAPQGLCNPYRGYPQYLYDNSTCLRPWSCKPKARRCPPRVIDSMAFTQNLEAHICTGKANESCLIKEVASVITAGQFIAQNLQGLVALMQQVLRCAYIIHLAQNVAQRTSDLGYDATLLWCGFLLISVGAMVFAICLPIYSYRAARCYGEHDGDADDENWEDQDEEWADGKNADYNEEEEEDEEQEDEDDGDGHRHHDEDDDDDDDRDRRRDDRSEGSDGSGNRRDDDGYDDERGRHYESEDTRDESDREGGRWGRR